MDFPLFSFIPIRFRIHHSLLYVLVLQWWHSPQNNRVWFVIFFSLLFFFACALIVMVILGFLFEYARTTHGWLSQVKRHHHRVCVCMCACVYIWNSALAVGWYANFNRWRLCFLNSIYCVFLWLSPLYTTIKCTTCKCEYVCETVFTCIANAKPLGIGKGASLYRIDVCVWCVLVWRGERCEFIGYIEIY